MQRAFITEYDTVLRTVEPWYLRARFDSRSAALLAAFGQQPPTQWGVYEQHILVFPTDTTFKVVRINIKKNQKSASAVLLRIVSSPLAALVGLSISVNLANFNAAGLVVVDDASVGGDDQEHPGAVYTRTELYKLAKKRLRNRVWVDVSFADGAPSVSGPLNVDIYASRTGSNVGVSVYSLRPLGSDDNRIDIRGNFPDTAQDVSYAGAARAGTVTLRHIVKKDRP